MAEQITSNVSRVGGQDGCDTRRQAGGTRRKAAQTNFLFVRDFSTSPASLNGLPPMGVEDACARETRVATKAYDLWISDTWGTVVQSAHLPLPV
jgi:hypothetical protein